MAQLTLTDFFGTTIAGLISGNEAAIETDFSLNTGAIAADPERLVHAVLINLREKVIADGTTDPSISIQSPSAGSEWTRSYNSQRSGQIGYTLSMQLWQTDSNPAAPDGDNAA